MHHRASHTILMPCPLSKALPRDTCNFELTKDSPRYGNFLINFDNMYAYTHLKIMLMLILCYKLQGSETTCSKKCKKGRLSQR